MALARPPATALARLLRPPAHVRPLSTTTGWEAAVVCASKTRGKPLRTKQKGIDILHDPLWN